MRKIIIAAAVALPIAGIAAYALAATTAPDANMSGTDALSASTTELASADQLTVKPPHKRLSIKGVFGDDDQGGGNEGIEHEGGEGPDSE